MILASCGKHFKFKVTYYSFKTCRSFPAPGNFPLAEFLCWSPLCPTAHFSSLLSTSNISLFSLVSGFLECSQEQPSQSQNFPPLLQLSHTPSTLCSLVFCFLNKGPSLFLQVKGPSTQRWIMAFSSRRQRPQSIGTLVILFPPRSTYKISFNPQNPSARRGETLEVQRC